MIRMSKLTDYAIVLMVHVARAKGLRTARELAQDAALPMPTVGKVLKVLSRHKFLVSTRGMRGGYALGRDASEIRIADLIEALEGPIALTECSAAPGNDACSHEQHCPVRAPWMQINEAVREALSSISLSDMTRSEFNLEEIRL
ncbi:MAG: SUF system Fe-S cluster assembly regulator [Myxococcota bacterium]|jgi:FeS assembly SUF system regulator|nr:SUF system Fe-S cluster assembly regulator [Myxococcota bacterium]